MASFPCSKALNVYHAWTASQVKFPEHQELLTESLNFLNQTMPRIFRATYKLRYLIYTDASDLGCGASLKTEGKEIKSAGLMWTAKQKVLHSTHKEALATSLAIKFLNPYVPKG